jgi:hypothetical protein
MCVYVAVAGSLSLQYKIPLYGYVIISHHELTENFNDFSFYRVVLKSSTVDFLSSCDGLSHSALHIFTYNLFFVVLRNQTPKSSNYA